MALRNINSMRNMINESPREVKKRSRATTDLAFFLYAGVLVIGSSRTPYLHRDLVPEIWPQERPFAD